MSRNIAAVGDEDNRSAAEQAVDFLKSIAAEGRIAVASIVPDGSFRGATFNLHADHGRLADWISTRNGSSNLYYAVNEPKPSAEQVGIAGGLEKQDISSIRGIIVDLDPRDGADFQGERSRLLGLAEEWQRHQVAPPSVVVDSGGGIQMVWLLGGPLPNTDAAQAAVEAQARGLIAMFGPGSDAVQSVQHWFRIPFTTNLPNRKKRERGRVQCEARLLSMTPRRYRLDELAALAQPIARPSPSHSAGALDRFDYSAVIDAAEGGEIEAELKTHIGEIRCSPKGKTLLANPDRSDRDFGLACACSERGITDPTQIGQVTFALSPDRLREDDEKGKGQQYAERTIAKALARLASKAPEAHFENLDAEVRTTTGAVSDRDDPSTARQLKLLTLDEMLAKDLDDGPDPLVEGLLDQGGMSVLYGDSNVGKTFAAMGLAFHVAAGLEWAGQKTTQTNVVYVATEGGRATARRLRALVLETGVNPAGFRIYPSSIDLLRADADLEPLIRAVNAIGNVGLVVIDTVSRALAGGDENSSVDMGKFVRNLDRVKERTGAHVMGIHHSGKNAAKGARGHSLLRAATDTEIEMTEGQITATKQRDMPIDFQRSFTRTVHTLGFGRTGRIFTSCTLKFAPVKAASAEGATQAEAEVLEALRRLHDASPGASGFSAKDIEGTGCLGTVENDAVRKRASRLVAKGQIVFCGRGRWRLRSDTAATAPGERAHVDKLSEYAEGIFQ